MPFDPELWHIPPEHAGDMRGFHWDKTKYLSMTPRAQSYWRELAGPLPASWGLEANPPADDVQTYALSREDQDAIRQTIVEAGKMLERAFEDMWADLLPDLTKAIQDLQASEAAAVLNQNNDEIEEELMPKMELDANDQAVLNKLTKQTVEVTEEQQAAILAARAARNGPRVWTEDDIVAFNNDNLQLTDAERVEFQKFLSQRLQREMYGKVVS